MKSVNVVCAVIKKDNLIFVTQRGYGEFKGFWEFPGGKIEENETDEKALIREINEELNASIRVDQYLTKVEYDYTTFHLSMKAFICHLTNPHIELLEHEDSEWVDISKLNTINFLPADKIVVDAIRKLYLMM